jgi:hypothetical protein
MDVFVLDNPYDQKISIDNMPEALSSDKTRCKKNLYPFLEHFDIAIVYNTSKKYLANKKEKQLI